MNEETKSQMEPVKAGSDLNDRLGVIRDLIECCRSWERDARILGNVSAGDAADALASMFYDDPQRKCLDFGFKYWRAPDAHGVVCTKEQAVTFMQEMLGVEVEIKDA